RCRHSQEPGRSKPQHGEEDNAGVKASPRGRDVNGGCGAFAHRLLSQHGNTNLKIFIRYEAYNTTPRKPRQPCERAECAQSLTTLWESGGKMPRPRPRSASGCTLTGFRRVLCP